MFLRETKYLGSNLGRSEFRLVVLGVTGCFRGSLGCF